METISVKSIGNIDSFSTELSNVLVFCGKEYETKIAFAKLIALFRTWEFQGKLIDYQNLLERFSISNILNSDSRINYESSMRKITFNGKFFEVVSKISKSDESIRGEEIFKKQVIDILQEAMLESSKSNKHEYLYEKLAEIKVNIDNLVVIPAQRDLIAAFSDTFNLLKGSNLPMQNSLFDFKIRLQKARNIINECNLEKWNLRYKYIDGEDFITDKFGQTRKLSDCNPITQSILPLKLVLEYYSKISDKNQKTAIKNLKKLSYLIEEPELHLHEDYYPPILDLIFSCINNEINDLIINTNQKEIALLVRDKIKSCKIYEFNE